MLRLLLLSSKSRGKVWPEQAFCLMSSQDPKILTFDNFLHGTDFAGCIALSLLLSFWGKESPIVIRSLNKSMQRTVNLPRYSSNQNASIQFPWHKKHDISSNRNQAYKCTQIPVSRTSMQQTDNQCLHRQNRINLHNKDELHSSCCLGDFHCCPGSRILACGAQIPKSYQKSHSKGSCLICTQGSLFGGFFYAKKA